MKVSIVTISYNQAAFLEQTIRSVIEQDYPEIEYIIVDPGSTDESRNIIEKYRSKFTHIIYEPDDGPADGLNKGFRIAKGEIYGFLNSDDYLLPGAIRKVVDHFYKKPSIDVVSGNAFIIDDKGCIIRKAYSDHYSLFGAAFGASNLLQQATFFRATAFKKTRGFNIDNRTSWDGELFVDLKLNGANFDRCDEYLGAFRIHPDSISGSARLKDTYHQDCEKQFQKILHRKKTWYDPFIIYGFRFSRMFTNPRAIFERIKMNLFRWSRISEF